MKIIDVSRYNGIVSWVKVADSCDGAIIRVGYRGYGSGKLAIDERFKENIKAATAAGVLIGVYFVTQAITEAEARAEARYTLDQIKGYRLDLPIYIDSEDANNGAGRADHGRLSKAYRTAIVNAFCNDIIKAGYKAGIYASESWFKERLNLANIPLNYSMWVAKYSTKKPNIPYDLWQYTSNGRVDGVKGNVDLSESKEDIKPIKKAAEEIADEVIAGYWGNGAHRKSRLEAAGYKYSVIQSLVNEKLTGKADYYIVKAGDTLSSIAKEHKTTVNRLKYANGLKDPNKIYIGQKLRIE